MIEYPFKLETAWAAAGSPSSADASSTVSVDHSRGRIPSPQASRLRSMILEAQRSENTILAVPCSDDALTSRLIEDAGFPFIFLSGFLVASSLGLPDTGYIAFQDMLNRLQEVVRQVKIPIMVDGDTGYGSAPQVRRTVQGFALAGAAGVMIEDQVWPKRCGHTRGKSVVSRVEAFARVQAAVDARNEGVDIVINARTDSLILGWEEAMFRASKFAEIGADLIFIEALPDRKSMEKAVMELKLPLMANIIGGGLTENLSAQTLGTMGFSVAAMPFPLLAAKIKSMRDTLEELKKSLVEGPPPQCLSFSELCEAVGFHEYWDLEKRYPSH